MSSYYLCDTCWRKAFDLSPSEAWCAPKDEEVEKIAVHDGMEIPTDVCEYYENEEELNARRAGAVETSQGA